jgi:ring-1,2-phenylacetyl-CoA epoxidase subunit PaaE
VSKLHNIQIAAIERLTDDASCISFNIPDDLAPTFAFQPGQYLAVDLDFKNGPARRSYSICSPKGQSQLSIGVKSVDGGLVSTYLNENAKVGDTIRLMPPEGKFTVTLGGRHIYLLVAAGSGITPCLSIARSVLENEPDSIVHMLYGNQSSKSIMFRDQLDWLKDKYTERFVLNYVTSRERQDAKILNGRIDGDKINQLTTKHVIEPLNYDGIYLCGPQQMIETVRATLGDLNVDPDKIHFELFGTAPLDAAALAKKADAAVRDANVQIIMDGAAKDIHVDGAKQTILAAAQESGLDLPFSCAAGMCCTCRCKVIEGKAEMDANYALQDWEVEAGFVLSCQSRPASDKLVLDFDAV